MCSVGRKSFRWFCGGVVFDSDKNNDIGSE